MKKNVYKNIILIFLVMTIFGLSPFVLSYWENESSYYAEGLTNISIGNWINLNIPEDTFEILPGHEYDDRDFEKGEIFSYNGELYRVNSDYNSKEHGPPGPGNIWAWRIISKIEYQPNTVYVEHQVVKVGERYFTAKWTYVNHDPLTNHGNIGGNNSGQPWLEIYPISNDKFNYYVTYGGDKIYDYSRPILNMGYLIRYSPGGTEHNVVIS